MKAEDIYIKLTDPTGRRETVVNYHRVWDRTLFLAAQRKLHETPRDPNDELSVSVVSEAEYKASRGRK